jgi:hypothetical protein
MTEYELVDAAASYLAALQTWIATYFTILTAYLITAYVAGIKLGRSQVYIINVGFVVLGGLCAIGATGTAARFLEFTRQVAEVNPQRIYLASAPMSWAISAVLFGGLLAALKFMWDVRHPKTE